MKDQNYIVLDKKGAEVIVSARTAAEALGIFLKRGRFGLGAGWILTRQPDGWILASNKTGKTLERTYHKLREQDYTRTHKRYSNVA
jgi:hypothetical protein